MLLPILTAKAETPFPQTCRQHVIVLYDFSWRVLDHAHENVNRVNGYVSQILFENAVSYGAKDYKEGVLPKGLTLPLWTPGDCLSFYTFGVSREDLEANLPKVSSQKFWKAWQEALIHDSPNHQIGSDLSNARKFVSENLRRTGSQPYFYTLSYYVLPALIPKLPSVYSERQILIWISDFLPDDPVLQPLDEGLVENRLPPYVSLLHDARGQFEQLGISRQPQFRVRLTSPTIYLAILTFDVPVKFNFEVQGSLQLRQTNKDWILHLPRLTFGSATSAFSDNLLLVDLSRRTKRLAQVSKSLSQSKDPFPDSETTVVLDEDLTAGTELSASITATGDYSPTNRFGFSLPIKSETKVLPVDVVLLPPFWKRSLPIGLPMIGVFASFVWFVFGRKPKVSYSVVEERLPIQKERLIASNHKYPQLLWVDGFTYEIPIEIGNCGGWLNRRGFRPILSLGPVINNSSYSSTVNVDLHSEKGFTCGVGDPLRLPTIKSGVRLQVYVRVHLGICPLSDDQMAGPFTIQVAVRNSHSEIGKVTWSFVLTPDLGNFWIGLDPGTSGACVAGGTNPGELTLVDIGPGPTEENRYVAPSLVYICRDSQEGKALQALTHKVGERELSYLAGDKASPFVGLREAQDRIFRSAKRLIGYGNRFSCEYEGRIVAIQGRDAVEMLAKYLLKEAQQFFTRKWSDNNGRKFKMNKVVLAVPNTFTPGKIQQMRECCQVLGINLKNVHTIYEAEAVLMYYWWQTAKLIKKSEAEVDSLRRRGEFVLVVDFGGGSVNYTYARLVKRRERDSAHLDVHVLQRIGFSLGGDHLDWEIASLLWAGIRHDPRFRGVDPYESRSRINVRPLRNMLLQTAADVKLQASNLWQQGKADAPSSLSAEEFRSWKGLAPSASAIMNHKGIQGRLTELEEGLKELVTLCTQSECWRAVDTLIFSGRSTRFPGVKKAIVDVLADINSDVEPQIVDLGESAKTCVARGAAFWGMQKNNITLKSEHAFANYGAVRHQVEKAEPEFDLLVRPGKEFKDGTCRGEIKDIKYQFNNNELALYQIMGSDPIKALLDPTKYARKSLLTVFTIDSSKTVDLVELKLHRDDRFAARLRQQGYGQQESSGSYTLDDIRKDGDPSTEWLIEQIELSEVHIASYS